MIQGRQVGRHVVLLCVLGGVALLAHPAALAQDAPSVVVKEPAEGAMLVGPSVLAADVLPDSQAVEQVEFFVDGRSVCVARQRPFRCRWEAGTSVRPRAVRVVATLPGDRRLTATRRTGGMMVSDAVNVDAIAISVRVLDREGRFVTGLTRDDFSIYEDDVRQEIGGFAAEDAGAQVVVALDASESMAPAMPAVRAATGLFLRTLRAQDEVTIAAFSTSLSVVALPTASLDERIAVLETLTAGGNTALYDAMVRSADLFHGFGQRAVVIFTDGRDVVSRASVGGVRTALQSADAGLYVVGQGEAARSGDLRDLLTALARETGGASYFSSRADALQEHFAEIAEDISHRYLLSFTPIRPLGDGAWRALEIRLTNPALSHTIWAREGYPAIRRSGRDRLSVVR